MRSLLTAIVCIVFANWAGMLAAEGQTDWSGGPGAAMQSGDWDSRFAESEGISSVAIPGQIALSSTALEAPSATVIGDNLGAAYGLYAADMDRDGDMDVIGTTDTSAGVFLWVNHGGDPVDWERRDVDLDYPGGTSVHPADVDNGFRCQG